MITQQVVTYIKEQLSRGTAREKIRSNLLSAGWLEEDINQAFSFAEPNVPNAALKIAPAFAVENEIVKEIPVDKTSILKKDTEFMPILKKDQPTASPEPFVSQEINRPIAPVQINEQTTLDKPSEVIQNINSVVAPEVKMATQPEPLVNPAPTSSMVQQTVMSPAVSFGAIMPKSNSIQVDTVRTFSDDGGVTKLNNNKPSSVLKFIVVFLTIVLILGNLYMWMIVFPGMDNSNKKTVSLNEELVSDQQLTREMDVNSIDAVNNISVPVNPPEEFLVPTNKIQIAASSFFAKYNSYGGASMPMGSCNASGTVFSDVGVKSSLDELSTVTGRIPQCALGSDTNIDSTKIRTVSYMIYLPMEDGGYCIDSTGASLVVSKIPTGLSCTAGL
jgi:hypothetical protein